jgi:hypothetical protein
MGKPQYGPSFRLRTKTRKVAVSSESSNKAQRPTKCSPFLDQVYNCCAAYSLVSTAPVSSFRLNLIRFCNINTAVYVSFVLQTQGKHWSRDDSKSFVFENLLCTVQPKFLQKASLIRPSGRTGNLVNVLSDVCKECLWKAPLILISWNPWTDHLSKAVCRFLRVC